MKKFGATAILVTMLTGLLAWGGTTIISHAERLSVVETKEKSNKEILIEMKGDIKTLLRRGN